jgi:trimethylamine-N-oxide reductase (cytochrome c)
MLLGLVYVLRRTAKKHPSFQEEMKRHDGIVQIKLLDGSLGRYYKFENGTVSSSAGMHSRPDVTVGFKDLQTAFIIMNPNPDQREVIHAAKQFRAVVQGDDKLAVWFLQMLSHSRTIGLETGAKMPDGTVRYTTNTNGGPLFVYVKDDKIVRLTPIDLDDDDAPSWSINARGKTFTPQRKATANPHALALKSAIYSDKRNLYPMKRVDFDPNGARNPQNRGISGYERISWDEAYDMVANEINRQKTVHGPGSICTYPSDHHTWGNVGYYLSALMRFRNLVGVTSVHHSPDSWAGWYFGAQHHYGSSLRLGNPGFYSTVEDCLKEAEMIVFWSSDPESTNGPYGGFEGTQRRFWAKELGIDFVHIDPHLNPTAQLYGGKWIQPRPGTDSALAQAIMYVWIVEDLYDKNYVANRTTGFDEWRDYLLGNSDHEPKTPEWQEKETGVPARVVRALARNWGKKKTYLSAGGVGAGFGGASRSATGTQWARNMILMMAMQGWGKPGINFGNLQIGTPVSSTFYFPGYAEGGISGELQWTASAINNYCRMPHVLTMNPIKQMIPRQSLPEAIIEGKASGYLWDGISLEAQMVPFEYPMAGYSPVHMLYRYGASAFGTLTKSDRLVEMYRHPSLECVVSQSIWFEGEAKYADIILPACTSFERWDISEWSNTSGYVYHFTAQLNHRIVTMQHKCIEPLGESKSDYDIFSGILQRLGLGAMYTEGCNEFDWCKRVFDSSDLPSFGGVKWKDFLKKGYYVVPPEPEETRDPVYMKWYAEDRVKDVPEPHPLPSQFQEKFGKGLQTQSGKIEFVSSSLKRLSSGDHSSRPALNRYIPSWEGLHAEELAEKYPLQMISNHSRYSFHTYVDGKGSTINDIKDHRVLIDGYYYWVVRMNPKDACDRGLAQHDLVRIFNDRGSVICAVDISPLVMSGVVKTFEASAEFDPIDADGNIDRGGCMNILVSRRRESGTESITPNSCLVQIEAWAGSAEVSMPVEASLE